MHSKLGKDYEMEPKTAKSFILQTSNQEMQLVSQSSVPVNQMVFKNKTKDQVIQLAPWLLTVNEIGRYSNWETFLKHIEYAQDPSIARNRTIIESVSQDREDSNFSCGSITVGDYQGQWTCLPTSYLIDTNYNFTPYKTWNNLELQKLILSWVNDPSDSDLKEWPEIKKELNDHKLKFPHDT